MTTSSHYPLVPKNHAPAIYDGVAVQNTWNTVLDTTPNVRIYDISFLMDIANEDIEVKITFDGITNTVTQTAVAGTEYCIRRMYNDSDNTSMLWVWAAPASAYLHGFLFEARSIKVEIRKTSANGANNLACKVIYGLAS